MKAPDRQPDWHHLVCLGVLMMPGATHRSPVAQTPTVLWLQRVMNHSHRKGHHQQTTSSHMCPRPAAQPPAWNHWVGKHRGGHRQIAISHSPQRAWQRQGQTGRSLANLSMSLISLRPYIVCSVCRKSTVPCYYFCVFTVFPQELQSNLNNT